MISWIQTTFQHHFRAIFGALLAVTIISFIATIGASPGVGRADHGAAKAEFFGHNLAAAADVRQIDGDAQLSIELQAGYNPYQADQVHKFGLQRIAALHLADQWHLPAPTGQEMTDYIKTLRIFAGNDGQFDASKYASVRTSMASSPGGEAEVARVLTDDIRCNQVNSILAGPGYLQPAEVKAELLRDDTTWTVGTAEVDFASFHPAPAVTDAKVAAYFQANALRYQIPASVLESYVAFPFLTYLRQTKVTDAEVRAYYDRDPSRFPKPTPVKDPKAKTPAVTPKADPAADYAAVKPQVEGALKVEKARKQAAKDASDFAFSLYQNKVTADGATAYLEARHIPEKKLSPFTEETVPPELGGSREIGQAAFELSAEKFYSEALSTPAGSIVLLWKGSLPPRQPKLAEVKDKVKTDLMDEDRRTAFADLGKKLKTQLAASLKSGQPFDKAVAAAAAADNVKITAKTLPAFKLSEPPKDFNPAVSTALQHLNPGEFSDLDLSSDQNLLVYAFTKKAPDLAETSPRFAAVRAQKGSYLARMGTGEYLNQLVDQEVKRADAALR
jgi:peptidyl-prolyl cis-trans isomerase D